MIDKSYLQQLTVQCRRILIENSQRKMPLKEFQQLYAQYYLKSCNLDELKQNLSDVVQVSYDVILPSKYFLRQKENMKLTETQFQFTVVNDEQFIELTPLHCFACDLYHVMMNYGGTMKLSQFEVAYLSIIGSVCKPASYGFPTIFALLQALPCTVTIKVSRRKKNIIHLNKKLAGM